MGFRLVVVMKILEMYIFEVYFIFIELGILRFSYSVFIIFFGGFDVRLKFKMFIVLCILRG